MYEARRWADKVLVYCNYGMESILGIGKSYVWLEFVSFLVCFCHGRLESPDPSLSPGTG